MSDGDALLRAERDAAVADLSASQAHLALMTARRDRVERRLWEVGEAAAALLNARTYNEEEAARRLLKRVLTTEEKK